jgi:phytoene dehydrogenase-like protein
MMSLVKPLVDFIEGRGGRLLLRHEVVGIRRMPEGYAVQTRKHGGFQCRFMVSAIPLNNVLPLFGGDLQQRWESSILPPGDLRSAFSMGVAFRRRHEPDCLHHQIHLGSPLPQIGGNSIFLSLSHPLDTSRCKADECVASISTHIFDPGRHQVTDKAEIESCIVDVLVQHGFLEREDILYRHSSSQQSWEKWTGRAHGFVGGYPQYMGIKPWKMKDARLDGKGAYLCGDSTYPGQGIPGACLSGIIAVEKLASDHRL